ncbi:hypothetical protein BN2537_10021 [Streptomyces venezuelae]|nr:hypothetical protein BN2537_10021 [Streptomyces venezuelae]
MLRPDRGRATAAALWYPWSGPERAVEALPEYFCGSCPSMPPRVDE